jgi:hypothetical protein
MVYRRAGSLVATLSCVLALLALSACSGSAKPRQTVTEYVDPSPTAASTSPGSSAPSTSASVAPPTPPASMTKLAGSCDDKLPSNVVGPAIGESLPGVTAFVVGTPDASIHRVSYINCRYGLADQNATPAVEIQVSLYGTAAQADARIAPTVTDYKNHGATAQQANATGIPATILTGGTAAGYDTATLILAFGQRTVAVSLSDAIAADKQVADLTTLAALAVKRTQ